MESSRLIAWDSKPTQNHSPHLYFNDILCVSTLAEESVIHKVEKHLQLYDTQNMHYKEDRLSGVKTDNVLYTCILRYLFWDQI